MEIDMKTLDVKYESGIGKRISLGSTTTNYKTYYIPLKDLYYNSLNGRIATYVGEYNSNNDVSLDKLQQVDVEKFNDIIGDFIVKSATDGGKSFKETKLRIRQNGQTNPGVILNNGRIVDGNRRFTALRELYKETGDQRYAYFECVVLKAPNPDDEDSWKKIRLLEVNLQFYDDPIRDYDPIDKLVSFYDACIREGHLCTRAEYQNSSGMKNEEYNRDEAKAKIMVDYLNWRQKPEQFYIARDEKLDGVFSEIQSAFGGQLDSFFTSELKNDIYKYITLSSGDKHNNVRQLIQSAKNGGALYDNFRSKISNIPENRILVEEAVLAQDEKPKTPIETEKRNKTLMDASKLLNDVITDGLIEEKTEKSANDSINDLKKALTSLNKINFDDVNNYPDARKKSFLEELEKVKSKILEIEDGTK